ncbi:MAG: MG2 domain-containing protein, partial [Nitrososphaera sp.]
RTEYPRVEAQGDSQVTVQTEYHLYRAGDAVRVMGSVSEEMRQETESDTVNVLLMNADGTVTGQQQTTIESNGEYTATINLASDAQSGEYSAGSKIEVEASLLGLLDAEIVAKLESPKASFVVGAESSHDVEAEGGEAFSIEIASNSNIDNVELVEEEKKLMFTVEGETGTKGVTEVTIPTAMLSGEMMVVIDGQVVSSSSSDVILKSQTSADVKFEINYSHSEHSVEVTGTNVVPEFPMAAIVMAVAVGSAMVLAAKTKFGSQIRKI